MGLQGENWRLYWVSVGLSRKAEREKRNGHAYSSVTSPCWTGSTNNLSTAYKRGQTGPGAIQQEVIRNRKAAFISVGNDMQVLA